MNDMSLNTVEEAAGRLRLRVPTIRKWLLLRKLAFHKVGSRTMIPDSEIRRILDEGFSPALEQR